MSPTRIQSLPNRCIQAKKGVLIKGGRPLEVLSKVGAAAFDKTKTLTVGVPGVREVVPLHNASEVDVLSDAAGLEKFSSHPLARAIEQHAARRGVDAHAMDTFANVAGRGATANCLVCSTKEHAIGNLHHIGASATTCDEVVAVVDRLESGGQTAVLVSEGTTVIGVIGVTDELRPESPAVIAAIKKLGVTPVMLTGDNERAAHAVAERIGIDEVHGTLLPEQKAELIDQLQTTHGRVAMSRIARVCAAGASVLGLAAVPSRFGGDRGARPPRTRLGYRRVPIPPARHGLSGRQLRPQRVYRGDTVD